MPCFAGFERNKNWKVCAINGTKSLAKVRELVDEWHWHRFGYLHLILQTLKNELQPSHPVPMNQWQRNSKDCLLHLAGCAISNPMKKHCKCQLDYFNFVFPCQWQRDFKKHFLNSKSCCRTNYCYCYCRLLQKMSSSCHCVDEDVLKLYLLMASLSLEGPWWQ